jgi:anti-anti-sigma regulatory factor
MMASIAVLQTLDEGDLAEQLNKAFSKLEGAEGEVVLDFSSIRRIPPAGLHALEKLAAKSEDKPAKFVLRGVNVDVYKVLKLARLSGRFGFVS